MTLREMHLEWQSLEALRKSRDLTGEETEAHRLLGILLGHARETAAQASATGGTLEDLDRNARAAEQDDVPTTPSLPIVTHTSTPTTPAPPPRVFPTHARLRIHEARVEEALSTLDRITDDPELAGLRHEARELLTVLYGLSRASEMPERVDLVAMSHDEKASLYQRINALCDNVAALSLQRGIGGPAQ